MHNMWDRIQRKEYTKRRRWSMLQYDTVSQRIQKLWNYVNTSRFVRFADRFNLGVQRHCLPGSPSHKDSNTPVGRPANKCLCSVKRTYWSTACVSISDRLCVQQLHIQQREHNLIGWPILGLLNAALNAKSYKSLQVFRSSWTSRISCNMPAGSARKRARTAYGWTNIV